jgi:hypothetical protein
MPYLEIPDLPPAQGRALAQIFQDLAAELLRRARHAEGQEESRRRLQARVAAIRDVWGKVTMRQQAGADLDAAIAAVAEDLDMPEETVRAAWRLGAQGRGRHKRRLRDLDVARRAARGEDYRHIARAHKLHHKTVSNIVRRLARHGTFDPAAQIDPAMEAQEAEAILLLGRKTIASELLEGEQP